VAPGGGGVWRASAIIGVMGADDVFHKLCDDVERRELRSALRSVEASVYLRDPVAQAETLAVVQDHERACAEMRASIVRLSETFTDFAAAFFGFLYSDCCDRWPDFPERVEAAQLRDPDAGWLDVAEELEGRERAAPRAEVDAAAFRMLRR
jgi:hypothetical protein